MDILLVILSVLFALLWLALEKGWFNEDDDNELSHHLPDNNDHR